MKILNILVRRYLPLEDLDQAVAFHEKLIGQTARLRFDYPEHDLSSHRSPRSCSLLAPNRA